MPFDPFTHPPPGHAECYHPLVSGLIRVFELDAGYFSDPIVGRLVSQRIDGEPYEALSYVWGDASKRHDITIDGATLSITANLHGALQAFRHPPADDGASGDASEGVPDAIPGARLPFRRLWADAVCINQEDLPERTSQVELMGRIFAGACRVLCWLGFESNHDPARRHTVEAVRFIHTFMADPDTALREARVLMLHHDASETLDEHVAHLTADERRRYAVQKREWEAVKVFFEVEYFHRTWIVQELGLAREAVLYTAVRPTDRTNDDGSERDLSKAVVELESVDWPLVGRFVKYLDTTGASLVTHLGLVCWVAHHMLMIWEMQPDGKPVWDFLTGMHWARILKVTDARDRVYGLLGHPDATAHGELVAKPDYAHTRGVIYTRLAAGFIERTKSLYGVMFVDHEEDPTLHAREWDAEDDGRMPSWVPDWHSINRTTPLDYTYPGAELLDSAVRIEGDLHGDAGSLMPHLLVSSWIVDEIVAVSRQMETTDFPVTHLTREVAKKNSFWLDRIWEDVVRSANGFAEGDALAALEALSLAVSCGTEEIEPLPGQRLSGHQTEKEHHESFAKYVMEYHDLRAEADKIDVGDPALKETYIPARSLFDTLPPSAQSVIRQRAEGASSGKWLECMTWPAMCRTIFRTASGFVGMGSRITRPGDLVCRVKGSATLMTLRSSANLSLDALSELEMNEEIMCAYIAPTVVPSRMVQGRTDGSTFGEKPMRFRIV